MSDDVAYKKMLEGKISSKKYARDLKKEVRRARNAADERFVRRDEGGRPTPA